MALDGVAVSQPARRISISISFDQVQELEREIRIRSVKDDEDEDENDDKQDAPGGKDTDPRADGTSEASSRFFQDQEFEGLHIMGRIRSAMVDIGPDRHREAYSTPPETQDALYSPVLQELRAELEQKYDLNNMESFSYALAVNPNCTMAGLLDDNPDEAVCLLAGRNCLAWEYANYLDYTFFPLGFHPTHGNFSSPEQTAFLKNNLLTIIKDNLSVQNEPSTIFRRIQTSKGLSSTALKIFWPARDQEQQPLSSP